MDEEAIGCQAALKLLSEALKPKGISIIVPAKIALGVVAVFLSDGHYGVIFRTNFAQPRQRYINESGGEQRVMPKPWQGRHLGFLWTECRHEVSNFSWFLNHYARKLFKDGVAWFDEPEPIPWQQSRQGPSIVDVALASKDPKRWRSGKTEVHFVPGLDDSESAERLAALSEIDLGFDPKPFTDIG